jgi:hypothetical protein
MEEKKVAQTKPLEILIEEETQEMYALINKYALSPGMSVLILKDILHSCLIAEKGITQGYKVSTALATSPIVSNIPTGSEKQTSTPKNTVVDVNTPK